MKKLLLGVITFALIFTSCNKYADDFAELKTSIAALDAKVAGVITLQTNLASVTAQLTTLQTAVNGLPTTASITALSTSLGTLTTNVGALQTLLNTVATTGTANATSIATLTTTLNKVVTDKLAADIVLNGKLDALTAKLALAATSAEVQAIKTSILNQILASSLTTDNNVNAKIAQQKLDIQAAITAGTTDVDAKIAALKLVVDAGNTATINQITALLATLQGYASTATDTVTSFIEGLQLALAAAQKDIATILASTAMYNGDVNLTVDAEVDFFFAKLSVLPIVNGSVTVNPTLISAGKRANLATILSKIGAVIGTAPNVLITQTAAADAMAFTNLSSVKGNLTVASVSGGTVSFPLLTSIGGTYTNTGANALEPLLSTVGGDLIWNFDGDYTSTSLTSVGGVMTLTPFTTTGTTVVGTVLVTFPSLTVTGAINGGTLAFPSATTIDVKSTANLTTVTGTNLTSVKLRNTAYAGGLTVTPKSTGTVDLSAATSFAGGLTVAAGTTVNAGNALTGGAITITTVAAGAVDLTKFNSNVAVTINGATTVFLPALVAGTLTFPAATTVNLASFQGASYPTMPAVTILTIGALNNPYSVAGYTTLVTLNVTGKAVTTNPMPTGAMASLAATTANTALKTVAIGAGSLEVLSLSDCAALTSLTTLGVVNTFILNNCDALVNATLGHTHYIGGTGSVVTVTGNLKLASLTTSTDMMSSLTVTGNAALATANFASYQTKTFSGNPTITIGANKLAFTYANAVAATITTPYVETVITSVALSSLQVYVALYTAPVLSLNLDYIGTTATTLSSKMVADTFHTPAFAAAATGITTKAELVLVQ